MPYFLAVFLRAVLYLLSIIRTLIVIRAILSWFAGSSTTGNSLYTLLCQLTEPVVGPVREVLSRIPAMEQLPIDFSPLVAFLLLELISRLIYMI